ncbi:hypothetical protein O7608_18225 [Solwaraspora sp. WMMA2056]|uniref:hypothetical protein n=1 Tax=Solwaraspora sp. WMMA2056 TaxID=3015161 RepID=UPI00259BD090|nr:hypothetical protein [Solwaraspora sp. WMMA2056]WJK38440.1 hypothetical protein O7608_18225 [Solwaraspora sp. WMMA2056]
MRQQPLITINRSTVGDVLIQSTAPATGSTYQEEPKNPSDNDTRPRRSPVSALISALIAIGHLVGLGR